MKLEIGKMIGCNNCLTFFTVNHAPGVEVKDDQHWHCPQCGEMISPHDGQPGAPPHLGGKGGEGGSAGKAHSMALCYSCNGTGERHDGKIGTCTVCLGRLLIVHNPYLCNNVAPIQLMRCTLDLHHKAEHQCWTGGKLIAGWL